MPLDDRHMRPADFTARLFAVALLALVLFASSPGLEHLTARATDWASVIVIILGFFGLGTLLHSLVQVYRQQLRLHRLRSR